MYECLILGKVMAQHPEVPPSLLADVFESLVAAIYLDGGLAIAHFRLACLHARAGHGDHAMRGFNNTLKVLPDDDEQRVRLYSGGSDKEIKSTYEALKASLQKVGEPIGK